MAKGMHASIKNLNYFCRFQDLFQQKITLSIQNFQIKSDFVVNSQRTVFIYEEEPWNGKKLHEKKKTHEISIIASINDFNLHIIKEPDNERL